MIRWMLAATVMLTLSACACGQACLPYLDHTHKLQAKEWDGSLLQYGANDTHRWAWWVCWSVADPTKATVVRFVGLKSFPLSTVYARYAAVEAQANPLATLKLSMAGWATMPLTDPRMAPGVTAMNARICESVKIPECPTTP